MTAYRFFSIEKCSSYYTSVFFNLFAAAEPHMSVKITHALIHQSSDVHEIEATGCHFPNSAELSRQK